MTPEPGGGVEYISKLFSFTLIGSTHLALFQIGPSTKFRIKFECRTCLPIVGQIFFRHDAASALNILGNGLANRSVIKGRAALVGNLPQSPCKIGPCIIIALFKHFSRFLVQEETDDKDVC